MAKSIKVRAKEKDGEITVKCLMTHPMETGLRKDKKTGQAIPAHFIQEVTCDHDGKRVLTAYWGGGVSKNPYLSFKFKGSGGNVKIAWTDNKGETDVDETAVG
ncbi:MAG: thiosulfate oxidation carrier complex protein SoxZ [Chromatiales bacterium]|nr:thiosulfate oxidation carrier complex protein SoxZ [Chromatiales bacterium]